MIYLLQSRAGFITLGLVLILIPIFLYRKKVNWLQAIVLMTISTLIIALTLTNPRINKNLVDLNHFTDISNDFSFKNSDSRFQPWYASLQLIKENFWLGTAPSNLNEELVKKYRELGFEFALKNELNSHNQYLETLAGLGILGFLSLIFIMGYSFVISIQQRNYLLFFLMIILSINFLFESMLNRMAGILFMMFFMSLFIFAKIPESEGKSAGQLPDK
jgi:O-antigen ligase